MSPGASPYTIMLTVGQCADMVTIQGVGVIRLPLTRRFRVWMIFVAYVLVCPYSALGQTESASGQRPSAMVPPDWLFPVNPPSPAQPPVDRSAVRIPNSTITLLPSQLSDLFSAPDWHPLDHPAMPDVVA